MSQTKAELIKGLNINASAPATALQIDASGNVNIDSNTLYVDATNNRVGIGTSSPVLPLHVESTLRSVFRASTSDTGISNQLLFLNGSNYHYGTIGTVSGTGNVNGDVFGLGYTDAPITDFTPVLSWTANTGRVGIGTASPDELLTVASGTDRVGVNVSGTVSTLLIGNRNPATSCSSISFDRGDGSLRFNNGVTGAITERARIDSSGRLLVGTSTARSNFYNDTNSARVQIEGSGSNDNYALAVISNYAGNTNGAQLLLAKSGSSTVGGTTLVSNGDTIGQVNFQGADGTQFVPAASISGQVDGTPGASDMPGRLVFSTTADGASSPTERMRITKDGQTLLNYLSSSPIEQETFGVQGGGIVIARFTQNTNVSGYNGVRASIGSNGNNTSSYHFSGNTSGVNNWYLYGNGTTSYSSDERLKKNIETTRNGYLDDIRNLRVVKYNWKNHEDGTPKELGLIAQEVEQVFPGLVQDDLSPVSDEDPTIYKQLKSSVLSVILLKALQEAAEKIETLEARLSALETA